MARQRKAWDELTPTYRRRLERAGVTQDQYEAGASLSAARGHAATPERPELAERNPARYGKYLRPQNPAHVVNFIAEYTDDDGVKRSGVVTAEVRRKKDRSKIAEHLNAVADAVGAGVPKKVRAKTKPLASFAGVKVGGYPDPQAARLTRLADPTKYVRFTLITDPAKLAAIAAGTGFVFESFYRYSTAA